MGFVGATDDHSKTGEFREIGLDAMRILRMASESSKKSVDSRVQIGMGALGALGVRRIPYPATAGGTCLDCLNPGSRLLRGLKRVVRSPEPKSPLFFCPVGVGSGESPGYRSPVRLFEWCLGDGTLVSVFQSQRG